MSIPQSIQDKLMQFQPAVWLATWFSYRKQRLLIFFSFTIAVIGLGTGLAVQTSLIANLSHQSVQTAGLVVGLVGLAVLLPALGLHSYYLFYRLSLRDQHDTGQQFSLTYPAAQMLLDIAQSSTPLPALYRNNFGRELLLRAGLQLTDEIELPEYALSDDFWQQLTDRQAQAVLTVSELTECLLSTEEAVVEWLFSRGVTKKDLRQSARWVRRRNQRWVRQTRWWSLARTNSGLGIGSSLSYGQTPTLDKFTIAQTGEVFPTAPTAHSAFAEDVSAVFDILSRPRNANALLVGSPQRGTNDVLQEISVRLQRYRAPDRLKAYNLRVLDTGQLITIADSHRHFKQLTTKLLAEAATAGNVLLVIKNLPQLLAVGRKRDVDMLSLFEPAFSNPELPIITTARPADYNRQLTDSRIMQWLGSVSLHAVSSQTLMALLEETAESFSGSAMCTVSALRTVATSARELITDDEMPHAAVDLLLEVLAQKPEGVIGEVDVNEYVAKKTDVPTGEVTPQEREKLTNLEDNLHERVIGQDEAVSAVSEALRRNRTGVDAASETAGSFLFLGPTGVGKTETAKAVSAVYFGDEQVSVRFDMSEYSDETAAQRLIGTQGAVGRLSQAVSKRSHGVLLVDEFEKAHRRVHDLFLQILDEGFFTDGTGQSVHLDHMTIIATSNAGAQNIFAKVSAGEDPAEQSREIIDDLIADGVFRPELINRFDATVVFKPLSKQQLQRVTNKFLDNLSARIREQGYKLIITDQVPGYVADAGYDRRFGARAVQRFIQDTVENIVANKIIDKQKQRGEKIKLTTSDITSYTQSNDESAATNE